MGSRIKIYVKWTYEIYLALRVESRVPGSEKKRVLTLVDLIVKFIDPQRADWSVVT